MTRNTGGGRRIGATPRGTEVPKYRLTRAAPEQGAVEGLRTLFFEDEVAAIRGVAERLSEMEFATPGFAVAANGFVRTLRQTADRLAVPDRRSWDHAADVHSQWHGEHPWTECPVDALRRKAASK